MGRHCNLPHHIYVAVNNKYLGPDLPAGTTAGLWHAVYCRPGQLMLCHIVLETGAHWSGLPLHAISTNGDNSLSASELMPWGGMGDNLEAWDADYLEGLRVETLKGLGKGRHTGIVLDWVDGFSRYPQEHKPLSLLSLDSGQFALLPNNYFLVSDDHFTLDKQTAMSQLRQYRRGEAVWWEGG